MTTRVRARYDPEHEATRLHEQEFLSKQLRVLRARRGWVEMVQAVLLRSFGPGSVDLVRFRAVLGQLRNKREYIFEMDQESLQSMWDQARVGFGC